MTTDVASRGLHLPEVNWIVQYNPACTVADYVHRVGRTARVNAEGSALMFLGPSETSYLDLLANHRITLKEMKMDEILMSFLKFEHSFKGSPSQRAVEAATNLQLKIEHLILQEEDIHASAKKAYISFVRSYASYPREVKELFNFKALHLGHYAKSFGLRDTPKALGASSAYRAKLEKKEYHEKKEKKKQINIMKQKSGKLPRLAGMSEFDSGLDSIPNQKTKSSNKFDKTSSHSRINKVISKSKR